MKKRMKHKEPSFWTQLNKEKGLLLLCFVLAFFAWQAIRRNIGFELPITNIAVEVETPEGWAVLETSLDTADAIFLGSREDIRYLNREQLRVMVPITDPKPGKTVTIALQPKYLKNNPTGAKVVEFSPKQIEIRLDKEITRNLPVKATFDASQLPEGLEIESVVCKPATIQIKGAEQQLLKMENIRTEPIDLRNQQDDFKAISRVSLPAGGRLGSDSDRVTVEFKLKTYTHEKDFDLIPVRIMRGTGELRKITISPSTIAVRVRGQQTKVEQLQPENIIAYADCSDLETSGIYTLEVNVDLPSGISWVKGTNSVIKVQIEPF
ncbi:MAG: hypothetical protein JXR40_10075 [Pontiellaceae bacterium]|nr:hypothetical protein [Pontiellaceae bacterium]